MSKMQIEGQPSLEAYPGENGDICLRQGYLGEENKVITIPNAHVKKVIKWLQILHEERRNAPDEDFNAVDG